MKKEKIKYYDPKISEMNEKIINLTSILIFFILGFFLGYAADNFNKVEKQKYLEAENYNQYIQIKSLEETIYRYERGEF